MTRDGPHAEVDGRSRGPVLLAASGLAALAVAIGIGRFAFTPILPAMQSEHAVTLAQGGWLASANYLGYLVGSLWATAVRVRARTAIRLGLLTIGVCTLAMGVVHGFAIGLVLRAIPGVASAWVMVFLSAWILPKLARAGRGALSGTVYAGVGAGIVFAGLACLALFGLAASSDTAWIALGFAALFVTALVWPMLTDEHAPGSPVSVAAARSPRTIPQFWRLVFCYGAFGLGYIVPATFLPIMAKQTIADPRWFGWAWPAFGAAAVISTLLAARFAAVVAQRRIWMLANIVMGVGVLVPVVLPGLLAIAIAACFVGGTFMVNTMAGIQEARRLAGASARILIAAMTSAFAAGQIAGPLLVAGLVHLRNGFQAALIVSAVPLLVAAYLLSSPGPPAGRVAASIE